MPLSERDAKKLINQRHPEWLEHQLRWRWLLDSLEGGDRYRQAVYGIDRRSLPIRNMIRHKREYPDPREIDALNGRFGTSTYDAGTANGAASPAPSTLVIGQDPALYAQDDDYELRRARTPVPSFVAEVVDLYVSTIYSREIERRIGESGADDTTPPEYDPLVEWWEDVDGMGTTIDDWWKDTVAPLILTLGCLDLQFDHPRAPLGSVIKTKADAARLNLGKCIASHILPDNVLWWRLNPDGSYLDCLIREYLTGGEEIAGTGIGPGAAPLAPRAHYRYWTDAESTLYDQEGVVVETFAHPYGCVPVRRIFDRRKPRCKHVGMSRLDMIAEQQREYYNRDSELILSDTLQAHPLLQGPEDYVNSDGTIPVGPSWLLPKKKNSQGGTATYEGFDVIEFPKDGAESLRQNKADIREAVDRGASLMKPAGSGGTDRGTVAQSGVSKAIDHDGLHRKLSAIAKALGKGEKAAALMALTVLTDGAPPDDAADEIHVVYPTVFNLYAADELARIAGDFQSILSAAGDAPETETMILSEIARKALPGRDDATYERIDEEIEKAVEASAKSRSQRAESLAAPESAAGATDGNTPPPLALGKTSVPAVTDTDSEIGDTPEAPDGD